MSSHAQVPIITSDRPRQRYWLDRESILGPLLLLPTVLYIVGLVGFPLVLAILFSVSDATVGDQSFDFVGLDNFAHVIGDQTFQRALVHTIVFTLVSQLIVVFFANILALVLSAEFHGKRLVRFIVLLPWTTPIALGVLGWLWTLDNVFSPIDFLVRQTGLLGPSVGPFRVDNPVADLVRWLGWGSAFGTGSNVLWLARSTLAQITVVIVHVWRTLPLATVILLAGLTSIPQDVKDAANVDGAGFFRQLFYIRLPLLMPIMAVAFLYGIIFTFTDMTIPYILTNRGGPVDSTQVLASWAFIKGVEGGNLAEGAAIALFLFPVLVGVATLMLRLARRTETS